MPLAKFNFKAGINKEETDYAEEGGYVDANFIRFRKNRPEKIRSVFFPKFKMDIC